MGKAGKRRAVARLVGLTGLALTGLVLFTQISGALGAIPPPPTWSASLPRSSVLFNTTLPVMVYGPPHANFTVSLFSPPFGALPPLATYSYRLGNASANSTQAVDIAQVPTSDTLLGAEEAQVQNLTFGVVTTARFSVQPAANGTLALIVQEIANQQAEIDAQANHSAAEQSRYDAAHAYDVKIVGLALASDIFCVALVIWTRPQIDLVGWVRGAKSFGHSVVKEPVAIRPGYEGDEPVADVHPIPSRSYIGGKRFRGGCVRCRVPASAQEKILHLQTAHSIPRPKLGVDYELSRETMKGYMEEAKGTVPTGISKAVKKAVPTEAESFVGGS